MISVLGLARTDNSDINHDTPMGIRHLIATVEGLHNLHLWRDFLPSCSIIMGSISHRLYEGVSYALVLCCDNAESTDTSVAPIALCVMKKENSS